MMILDEDFTEVATFCKSGDDKVPVIIPGGQQVCPEPGTDDPPVSTVTNAEPLYWQGRLVFDELLKPDIEVLTDTDTGGPCTADSVTCDGHIDTTLPITLTCNGTAVAFDGLYDPTGNNVTLPPGPSIVFYPLDFVPTSANCEVSITDAVKDKDGNMVPAAQRGPYTWDIAPLALLGTDPEEGAEVDVDAVVDISFNSLIDPGSVAVDEITLTDGTTDVPFTVDSDSTELLLIPDAPLVAGTTYTLTIADGAELNDIGGGPYTQDGDLVVTFSVPAAN
ncbi:MAG: Ig-like domain-containing protein [Kofleriaceae bacterium]|nr:Ig-like domain-containing protein [Myxococcales bacterium]MCB9562130.1 Ig-like domain-containing protein [Kofleriaceae bacterium]